MTTYPKLDVTEVFSAIRENDLGIPRHQGGKNPCQKKTQAQQYASVLSDENAIARIKSWVLGHQKGLKSSTSALKLAGELRYAELHRELSALRDIQTDQLSSYDEALSNGLKKGGVRRKLFLPLAAAVFREEPKVRLCRFINLSGICSQMRAASDAIGIMASVSSDFEIEQFAEVADAIFDTLDRLDSERDLMLLRLICVLHVIFRCHKECGGVSSDLSNRMYQRFNGYLRIPESDRSIERLKSQVKSVVEKIVGTEVPDTMFSDEFEKWWISIFERVNQEGCDIIARLADDLRLIPGNPFRLTSSAEQNEIVDEESMQVPEDDTEKSGAESHSKQPSDGLDCVNSKSSPPEVPGTTEKAKALRESPPESRCPEILKIFGIVEDHMAVLEFDQYEDMQVEELRMLKMEAGRLSGRMERICSLIDDAINKENRGVSN